MNGMTPYIPVLVFSKEYKMFGMCKIDDTIHLTATKKGDRFDDYANAMNFARKTGLNFCKDKALKNEVAYVSVITDDMLEGADFGEPHIKPMKMLDIPPIEEPQHESIDWDTFLK